ncbi:mycofactocin dehydrogenase MftG [Rhodococcus opacus]|uniref:Glucose-methanol-choline oxidoreductase N-terminal domain-containing protein n=1 Tax=Rhodococcus opacus TaxID=37919 RepID=A0A076EHN9_RHOOP|nr:mycofactocin system GMC family oxidoreductase MftG [Rhodococcus opacus]AII05715.1 hypothetical protein EP51_14300 [Rhodococcus opacus]
MDGYNVIVVGAGSTGAVIAARLSERPNCTVTLLEAGPVYERLEDFPTSLLDPADMRESMPGAPHSWAMPGTILPGVQIPIPRGKVSGGSSSINGAYFERGTRADFDSWVKLGNDAWSYDEVLPYFKRSETDLNFATDVHGTEGPVRVNREAQDRSPEFTGAFEAACRELGFPEERDKNSGASGGFGPIPMNIDGGHRLSTAITYLLPAAQRPNLAVIGNAYVRRVLVENGRCVGVEADIDGERQVLRGDRIVVSAGALRSPHLLMHSGIGPAEHLRSHGIEVVVDLPGVGQNLMDHPELSMQWDMPGKHPATPGRGVITSALNWTSEGSDQIDDLEILPFVSTAADLMRITSMIKNPKQAFGALRNTSTKFLIEQAKALRFPFTVIGLQAEDSRGSVTLASADPTDAPRLDWNLLSEENDRRRMREGVRVAADLFGSNAMRSAKGRAVNLSASDLVDDKTIDEWVTQHIFAVGHPSCTCRMGPDDDQLAVVDQFGSVRGIEGLTVADTSIFPVLTSRGPNATAIMLGERIADVIATTQN